MNHVQTENKGSNRWLEHIRCFQEKFEFSRNGYIYIYIYAYLNVSNTKKILHHCHKELKSCDNSQAL